MRNSFWDVFKATVNAIIILLGKSASRTFIVWAFATHMMYIGLLSQDSWMMISMLFLGIRGALDWKTNVPTNETRTAEEVRN